MHAGHVLTTSIGILVGEKFFVNSIRRIRDGILAWHN